MSEVLAEKVSQLENRMDTAENDINEGKLLVMPMHANVEMLQGAIGDLKGEISKVRELLEERWYHHVCDLTVKLAEASGPALKVVAENENNQLRWVSFTLIACVVGPLALYFGATMALDFTGFTVGGTP